MTRNHYVEIHVDEDGYAEASAEAYSLAESSATAYPVVYPEPFNSVGCGWGTAGKFVERCAQDTATALGLDWECSNNVEIQLTLYCGTPAQYARFRRQLAEKIQVIATWVTIKP
ncbi:hypothetical protein [Rubrivivax gelatinosus]|uniref:hypothetical protein n=1 Tax=Rubrivivax gelatinosus TaxID=28068 RepID=UPI00030491DB|nr:hypothetical protein [Rubrivivax gelatinosus]MBG6083198.1 hypothetical protein [Rubrivivax gelatinosus]